VLDEVGKQLGLERCSRKGDIYLSQLVGGHLRHLMHTLAPWPRRPRRAGTLSVPALLARRTVLAPWRFVCLASPRFPKLDGVAFGVYRLGELPIGI